jgi:hypothetical protein
MTFNIGNQSAHVVNNVAGDQTVHGGQAGGTSDAPALLELLAAVRGAVADAELAEPTRTAVTDNLDALEGSVATGTETHTWRARFDDVLSLLAGAAGAVSNWGVLQTAISELGRGLGFLA